MKRNRLCALTLSLYSMKAFLNLQLHVLYRLTLKSDGLKIMFLLCICILFYVFSDDV